MSSQITVTTTLNCGKPDFQFIVGRREILIFENHDKHAQKVKIWTQAKDLMK